MNLKDQTRWKTMTDHGEHVIKGKVGQVSACGDSELDVWICDWTNTDRGMSYGHQRAVRMETSGWKAMNHYDDGGLFIRPESDLDQACRFIKARKRRHLTPEAQARGAARLAEWLRTKKTLVQTPISQDESPPSTK
jgi:hypothetical protein